MSGLLGGFQSGRACRPIIAATCTRLQGGSTLPVVANGVGTTRRGLLGGAAAAGAAAALPPGAEAKKRSRKRAPRKLRADVVVVGAGLAGLTAAREITKAGKRAVVVEARDRVGGRTYTRDVAGVPVDVGGQWIKTIPYQINEGQRTKDK